MIKKKGYQFQQWHLLVLVPVVYYGYQIVKKGKLLGVKITNDIKNDVAINATKQALLANGITDLRANVVNEVAEKVYRAFYKTTLWGMGEDEEAAVAAINELQNAPEAKACANIYKANYGKTLYADFMKFVSPLDGNHKDIKQNILIATKNVS